jgi:transposase
LPAAGREPDAADKDESTMPCSLDYCIGIDVSTAFLDTHGLPDSPRRRLSNTPDSHATLAALLSAQRAAGHSVLVVMEASGGCERAVHAALTAAGVPCAIVNPKRVRDFARAHGWLAKTDRVDAKALQAFGQATQPRPTPVPEPARAALIDLLDYRDQVLAEITARRQQLAHLHSPAVRARASEALDQLRSEAAALAELIAAAVEADPTLSRRAALVRSFKAAGPLTAALLVAHMPELGTLSEKQAASLAGLAPFACDSGTLRGVRRIYGGRPKVRHALFHIARVGLRHNPVLTRNLAVLRIAHPASARG